jgi:hypothetical protein
VYVYCLRMVKSIFDHHWSCQLLFGHSPFRDASTVMFQLASWVHYLIPLT